MDRELRLEEDAELSLRLRCCSASGMGITGGVGIGGGAGDVARGVAGGRLMLSGATGGKTNCSGMFILGESGAFNVSIELVPELRDQAVLVV